MLLLVPGILTCGWAGRAYLLASPFTFAPICVQFFCGVVLNAFQLIWHCVTFCGNMAKTAARQAYCDEGLWVDSTTLLLNAPEHAIVLLKHPALDQARYGKRWRRSTRGCIRH